MIVSQRLIALWHPFIYLHLCCLRVLHSDSLSLIHCHCTQSSQTPSICATVWGTLSFLVVANCTFIFASAVISAFLASLGYWTGCWKQWDSCTNCLLGFLPLIGFKNVFLVLPIEPFFNCSEFLKNTTYCFMGNRGGYCYCVSHNNTGTGGKLFTFLLNALICWAVIPSQEHSLLKGHLSPYL